jgi:hypothetical protein
VRDNTLNRKLTDVERQIARLDRPPDLLDVRKALAEIMHGLLRIAGKQQQQQTAKVAP